MMSGQPESGSNETEQAVLRKITDNLNRLTNIIAKRKGIDNDLHLNENEEAELEILIQETEKVFFNNDIPLSDPLYTKFSAILKENFSEARDGNKPMKKVRFDIDDQDNNLNDIYSKLKNNKNKIIKEIQPELFSHDGILKDLEQGFDTGLINLNKINHGSILPAWKRKGGNRREELKRGFLIGLLLLILFCLWLL